MQMELAGFNAYQIDLNILTNQVHYRPTLIFSECIYVHYEV